MCLKLLKNTINLDATIQSISIFFCYTFKVFTSDIQIGSIDLKIGINNFDIYISRIYYILQKFI